MLKSDEIQKDVFVKWLPPAEWGSQGRGDLIDNTPACSTGMLMGGDAADVFESLERYEEAIVAAERDIYMMSTICFVLCQSYVTIGRCQAKLGRPQEATAAFEAAIAEAQLCRVPFVEMLAHRDFIVHVLDKEGKRESQLAALGGAIRQMVMPAREYTAVLGAGLDAEAAVAAFEAQTS